VKGHYEKFGGTRRNQHKETYEGEGINSGTNNFKEFGLSSKARPHGISLTLNEEGNACGERDQGCFGDTKGTGKRHA